MNSDKNEQSVSRARPPLKRAPDGTLRRDDRLDHMVRQCRELATHLNNPVFGPVLQGFCRVSLMLNDSYEKIRKQELLNGDGELRSSIDTVRRLADTQMKLARELGLTPSTLKLLSREKDADLIGELAQNNGDDAEAE